MQVCRFAIVFHHLTRCRAGVRQTSLHLFTMDATDTFRPYHGRPSEPAPRVPETLICIFCGLREGPPDFRAEYGEVKTTLANPHDPEDKYETTRLHLD